MKLNSKIMKIKTLFLASIFLFLSTIGSLPFTYAVENIKSDNQKNEQIEVNCAFSIGPWCICNTYLERHKLRFQAAPLDSMGNWYRSEPIYSLDTVAHLFETKFEDFFEKTRLLDGKWATHRRVMDTKNGIVSIHHFPLNTPYRVYKKEFREMMLRRAGKVDEIMKKSDSIALISFRENTKEEFINFIKRFSKIYPNKKIYLINVRNVHSEKITCEELYAEGNLKIIEYSFFNEKYVNGIYNYRGNIPGWDKVMQSIKLVRKTI